MGTRGIFGLVAEEKVKVGYNHFDSYPESLGLNVLGAARRIISDFDNYYGRARHLRLVTDSDRPTPAQIRKLEKYANEGVSTGQKTEWYVLLRELQGDLLGTLDAGFIIDGFTFASDGLFCEWGWLVNFDDKTLECYRGFVKSVDPPPAGRFAADLNVESAWDGGPAYQPIHLLGTFPLSNLPGDDEFLEQIKVWMRESGELFGEEPYSDDDNEE